MKKYKEEANFKRCLEQLQLEDVVTAILRPKRSCSEMKGTDIP